MRNELVLSKIKLLFQREKEKICSLLKKVDFFSEDNLSFSL